MALCKVLKQDGEVKEWADESLGHSITLVNGVYTTVRDGYVSTANPSVLGGVWALTDEAYTPPSPVPIVPTLPKLNGVTFNEVRSLFSVTEITLMENFEADLAYTSIGKTALTPAQKIQMRTLLSEARATGAPGERGINLISPKMGGFLDALTAFGVLAAGRKAEIQAGVLKS